MLTLLPRKTGIHMGSHAIVVFFCPHAIFVHECPRGRSRATWDPACAVVGQGTRLFTRREVYQVLLLSLRWEQRGAVPVFILVVNIVVVVVVEITRRLMD